MIRKMNKDLTLLVLAAGMGSRFGGLKQIEPVGPNGEFIIDYSIYDAIKAGFNKVVFVIKEENLEIFKETVGKRIEGKIKVEYVFQKIDDVEEGVHIPEGRVKPLGTSHAVYAARGVIHENFAMINADDFYGRDAYFKAAEFLKNCIDGEYGNVAYKIGNTLSENGAVKRGIIFEENGDLTDIIESSVINKDGKALCEPLDGSNSFEVELDHPVSMNLLCLTPKILTFIKDHMVEFFNNPENDLNTCEYLIPNSLKDSAKFNNKAIKVIKNDGIYLGMTYREDLEILKSGILKEIEKGNYKNNLWG